MSQARLSYEFGPFRLDTSEHVLLRDGRPVPLTPKVFDVLCVLVENHGHLVEKERLLGEVWPDAFVEEGALNRSVSLLRKALGDSPSGQRYIQTAPKRGYRFVAPVTVSGAESDTTVTSSDSPEVDSDPTDTPPASPRRIGVRSAEGTRLSTRAAGMGGILLTAGALYYAVARPTELIRSLPPMPVPTHRQVTFTGKAGLPSLSPDGARIAYVSDDRPERTLMVQELEGGQPRAILNAREIGHLRWSPDGSEILVWVRDSAGRGGVRVIPRLGGRQRTIMEGQYVACWAPDGSTIAVGSYIGGRIWLVDRGGQVQRMLTLQGIRGSIRDIDWSPSNGRLLFVSDDGQWRHSIGTVRTDGTDQRTVVREDTEVQGARWGPGGDAFYYFRRLNQTVSLNKGVMHPDARDGDAVVTSLISGLETGLAFGLSADGTRLVYSRAPYYSNLWLLESRGDGDSLGFEPRPLTHGTSHIERPRVSPNGTSIVVNVGYQPATELYTMPLTGGPLKQLTFLEAFSAGGAWSPDGHSIAFGSTKGGVPRIWIVAAGGGVPRAVSSADLSEILDLTWAAGSRILYQQRGNQRYYVLDPETRDERLLTEESSAGWMFVPVHSPDGSKVAVSWSRRPKPGVWVIGIDDRSETFVYKTPTSRTSVFPVGWSADGRSIYLIEGRPYNFRDLSAPLGETTTDGRILRVPANGGDVTTVTSIPFDEFGSVAMAPDARRFVVTVYSSQSDVWVVDDFDVSSRRGPGGR
jgi:Tol biopolymer transport system component/DNA-binding winged helix-turn-helix (wHTH) protein